MIMTLEDVIQGYKEREMEHNKKQEQESYTKAVINHMKDNMKNLVQQNIQQLNHLVRRTFSINGNGFIRQQIYSNNNKIVIEHSGELR